MQAKLGIEMREQKQANPQRGGWGLDFCAGIGKISRSAEAWVRLALTKRTPSIMRLTLSFVMEAWLGMGMATSFNEWTYAIRST